MQATIAEITFLYPSEKQILSNITHWAILPGGTLQITQTTEQNNKTTQTTSLWPNGRWANCEITTTTTQ